MSGSPIIYNRSDGMRVVGIGGKTGSFFLRADDLTVVARRQLLPYQNGNPLSTIDNSGGDYGIFCSAAIDYSNHRLFVGMGSPGGFDSDSTPFIRSLDWDTLVDAWPTQTTGGIVRYNIRNNPFYQPTSRTAAGSSAAVSNGLVFITTRLPAVYAFESATGECLWQDTQIENFNLGLVIVGNMLVVAAGRNVYRWKSFTRGDSSPTITVRRSTGQDSVQGRRQTKTGPTARATGAVAPSLPTSMAMAGQTASS